MSAPKDLLYSDDHIWLMLEGDIATLGITEYGQQQLGEVVYAVSYTHLTLPTKA